MIITRLALQNNSFGGQHSRWGLGGIIRAGGPESAELSKPGAPNLLNNTHTPATVCDYAVTGVTYGNQRLWKAAAMTANLLPSETNCCSTPKRDVPADKATGSPHLEVLPGGGGGSANSRVSGHSGRQDSVNTLGGDLSLGSAAHGAASQLHRCVYTLNQLSSGLAADVKAAESGHWRCPLEAVLNKVSFTFSCFSFFFKNTFQYGHSALFFSFSSSATRTTLRDGNSRNLSGRQREAELTRRERTGLGVKLAIPRIPLPVKLFQNKSITDGANWLKLVLPIGTR